MKSLGVLSASGAALLSGCLGSSDNSGENETGEAEDGDAPSSEEFEFLDATVSEIHSAMASGDLSAEALTQRYLNRIEAYGDELNAFLHVNDDALERAQELDAELEESGPAGPLHGIPIALKDNFDTGDMPTTGGSLALEGVHPPDDATTVQWFREAGGIIIGKVNMHEFAWRWETYSSLGGQTPTPYDLSHVSGGSSGGSGASVAANLATLTTGSDTCGSIRVPAAFNNAVGVRGTLGLISRDGIMPMSERQDIGGPITRTVSDAAVMLDVMVGYDPADPSTARTVGNVPVDGDPPVTTAIGEDGDNEDGPSSYTDFLNEDGLNGAGIGVIREYLHEESPRQAVTDVVETNIETMSAEGADVVDPIEVPPDDNSLTFLEFHRELNDYLSTLDDPEAPEDLQALVDQPENLHPGIMSSMEGTLAVSIEGMDENLEYLQALAARDYYRTMDDADTEPGNKQQLLATMAEEDLDALVYPTVSGPPVEIPEEEGEVPVQPADSVNCTLSAGTGLPAVTVPGGFTDNGLPVGLELIGRPFSEGRLLEIAYSFEQATGHRRPPEGFGTL
ncbi:amidase family protein [Salinarchaeum chitinilyticum]